MTSPTSELFHLAIRDVVEPEEIDTEKSGVACVIFLLMKEVRPRRRQSWSDILCSQSCVVPQVSADRNSASLLRPFCLIRGGASDVSDSNSYNS